MTCVNYLTNRQISGNFYLHGETAYINTPILYLMNFMMKNSIYLSLCT